MLKINTLEEARVADDAKRMFINEQTTHLDLRFDFWLEMLNAIVWSPTSNRHTCWTDEPNRYARRLWG